MEREMLGIKLKDNKRENTDVKDTIKYISNTNWKWLGGGLMVVVVVVVVVGGGGGMMVW